MAEISSSERSDKVQVVMAAATRVFLAHGFSGATTDMIQREAGVSKATLYACFPNKEAMFSAVIAERCADMTASFRGIAPSSSDIASTLSTLGASYLDILLSPEGLALFRVVVAEAPRFPQIGREFYLAGPKVIAEVASRHLTLAAEQGILDLKAIGAPAAAQLFISLLRGEAHLECLTHPQARPSEAQRDLWVSAAVRMFLASFGRTA